ncbi:KISc [Nesidiocoris tenuis]|uniref:Kinesin-like protein n=1 Tax=Nesidiocoris tenuis TaxID=355587 RepID=A0ABN7AVZ3_9HEMI|nr:KISc [Nesidiocoris tenuis]
MQAPIIRSTIDTCVIAFGLRQVDDAGGQKGSEPPTPPDDNINVVVRVRPLNKRENSLNDGMTLEFPGNGQILVTGLNDVPGMKGTKTKLFSYNVVFEPGATQEDVLQYSGITRLINMAVDGFSSTAFCYGQTGSGKTHTLTGPPHLFTGKKVDIYSEDHGLIFKSFLYLFKVLQEKKECHFILKASFLEIYNEKVIDLLNPGTARKPLAVRWSKKSQRFFVENLFLVDCEELDDLLAVLEEGMKNRAVGAHMMNEHSSRSHTILTVHITSEQQMENGVFITKQGKINFVDLAGSEMTKKTHSEGKTLEEANNINKSLMVLGYCIASLSDHKKKNGHIPYRDSKLTKLLADSLAGNGVTLMIACVSPARSNVTETLNTLRYASRAKRIRNKPIVVMDPREALIISLKREVAALQNENDHLRTALRLSADAIANDPTLNASRINLKTPPNINFDRIAEMEPSELSDLVRHYAQENDALRKENTDLFLQRDLLIRDQELVCRENERLLKKLEDVNTVCVRSPLIGARPTLSAEALNNSVDLDGSNVWTNPLNSSTGSLQNLSGPTNAKNPTDRNGNVENRSKLVESFQKELERRQISKRRNPPKGNSKEKGTLPPIRPQIPTTENIFGADKPEDQQIVADRRRSDASAANAAGRRRQFVLGSRLPNSSPQNVLPRPENINDLFGAKEEPPEYYNDPFGSEISLRDEDNQDEIERKGSAKKEERK